MELKADIIRFRHGDVTNFNCNTKYELQKNKKDNKKVLTSNVEYVIIKKLSLR